MKHIAVISILYDHFLFNYKLISLDLYDYVTKKLTYLYVLNTYMVTF